MVAPTPSGTYNFAPSLGELVLYAFNNCEVRPSSLEQEHMTSARMAANLICSRWSNQGVNLWQVDLQTVTLVQGTATYSVPDNTVVMLDAYISLVQGSSPPVDRIILPVSRSEYASYSNKTVQGSVTVYWMDRLLSPTVTLYQVPDGVSGTYLKYYRLIQLQDANLTNGGQVDIPYLWLDAFADELSYRLARMWAPQRAADLKMIAKESYDIAAAQNIETASVYIGPMLSNYWRA